MRRQSCPPQMTLTLLMKIKHGYLLIEEFIEFTRIANSYGYASCEERSNAQVLLPSASLSTFGSILYYIVSNPFVAINDIVNGERSIFVRRLAQYYLVWIQITRRLWCATCWYRMMDNPPPRMQVFLVIFFEDFCMLPIL